MTDQTNPSEEHPRGTLALMAAIGVVFVLTYLAIYVFIYLPRGPVTQ